MNSWYFYSVCLQVKYALVEFEDKEHALKALRVPKLTLSGNKLVIKPRILQSQKTSTEPTPQPLSGAKQKSEPEEVDVGVAINAQDILQSSEVSDKSSAIGVCVCLL